MYLSKLSGEANGGDVNAIKREIDTIMQVGKGEHNIGLELLAEVLQGQDKLATPIHFYAENYLYKSASKERADLASVFAQMIPEQNKLTTNISNTHDSKLAQILNDNKALNIWCDDMSFQQPQNLKNIDLTKKGVEDLAKYYQHILKVAPSKAIDRAVKEMIENVYISPFEGLQIGKQIIDGGQVHSLDEGYIRNSLIHLRKNLINKEITFIIVSSFGQIDGLEEYAHEKITSMLAGGRWFLNDDKKSVYYAYLNDNGYYYPLMANENDKLSFDLLEINVPETDKLRLQRYNNEMQELLELLPNNMAY